MKKIILLLVFALAQNISFGQNFAELSNFHFDTPESYRTEEHKVLSCANFLFEHPANHEELNRLNSVQFILKWMEGTPDFTFDIGEKAMELTKGNKDLLGLYLAAMSKAVIENEGGPLDNDEIYHRAEKILVEYCSVPGNKMKPSKKIKKLIKTRKS